ncbi:cell division protein FtsA [Candidatus Dependentiae bacterium]|nr:cell division protein FtsA [Candidatus Dependentiae bacterium]MCC7414510.1 cell division protein FtsA [Campylobacterota bacterium]
MVKVSADRIRVAIDIGTTKICVIVAHKTSQEQIEVIGIGKAPSHGLRKGVVVDIAQTIRSIRQAVEEAELMTGYAITHAAIGVSGAHISSLNSYGAVPIKHNEVRTEDIAQVIAAARAIPIPEGQQILHTLPQYFLIDGHDKVQDPLGMHGIRLEASIHIILGAIASVQNLIKCCEMAGVQTTDIILEQLASAAAVLSDDECELGVAMLDIGGGTSDLALYQRRSIKHTMVLPVAGNHFTNDIAACLRVTLDTAERIKRQYGVACLEALEKDELIEVEMIHGGTNRLVNTTDLTAILEPRAQELLTIIHDEIIKKKLHSYMQAGLVLTGGGSLLHGIKELAEAIFQAPVRIGYPRACHNLPAALSSPQYATSYGLIVYMIKQEQISYKDSMQGPLLYRVFGRMKSWVGDFF